VETRRLQLLVELARLGSMRAVADELGYTTSTVSQQIAVLTREAGTPLVEPVGRRVRLTPAGRRLADHAVTILAAVTAARADLDPAADPTGTVRIAGFATAVRRSLLPVVSTLAADHPAVRVVVAEHEPAEALGLLTDDEVDLALTYDYDLAPASLDRTVEAVPLWSTAWSLGVPSDVIDEATGDAPSVVARCHRHDWIVNSRNIADEHVVRVLASMAGFEPRITHRADSLELVHDLVLGGLGVALLPADQAVPPGVRLLPLSGPGVALRAFAVFRRGRRAWAPLSLVIGLLAPRRPAPLGA
jgi:DNA-binding transcriptional LysR family regulator